VAGATYADVNVLRQFGHYTGMAFQIIDDVLDFSGSEQVVGKPVGGDLRQGNITLPALLAARDKKLGNRLSKLIVKGMPEEAAEEAIELIVESSALDLARQLADTYLHKALSVLRQVSVRRTQEELAILTHFVAERAF
jgi:heptaprenyl diphosphate synthase